MSRPDIPDEEFAKLAREAKESEKKIEDSRAFVSLFSPKYARDPICLIQLALAIMLNKPIILVVDKKTTIPPRLRQIADKIFYYWDEESFKAVAELLKNIEKELDT